MTNDELIKKVAYLLNNDGIMDDDYYLDSAEEIIAIVTEHNHEKVKAAVVELIELQFGLNPLIYRNSAHVDEAINAALNPTGDSDE